jgi:hypothetical protein
MLSVTSVAFSACGCGGKGIGLPGLPTIGYCPTALYVNAAPGRLSPENVYVTENCIHPRNNDGVFTGLRHGFIIYVTNPAASM